jgi:hypothetical protein
MATVFKSWFKQNSSRGKKSQPGSDSSKQNEKLIYRKSEEHETF